MSGETSAPPVAETGSGELTLEPGQVPGQQPQPGAQEEPRSARVLRDVLTGNLLLSVLAVVVSLVVGAVLIAVTNADVLAASAYFFARPGDTFAAIGAAVGGGYLSLVRGGLFDYTATDPGGALAPLLTSLGFATPLSGPRPFDYEFITQFNLTF